jgi:hypothetical protein
VLCFESWLGYRKTSPAPSAAAKLMSSPRSQRSAGYWSDGTGELIPYCPDYARREFAAHAPASGQVPWSMGERDAS